MNHPFEEGSLEHLIVQGMFRHANSKLGEASYDIYRMFGVLVKGEILLNYRVQDVITMANYIRDNPDMYLMETLEYLPTAFDVNTQ